MSEDLSRIERERQIIRSAVKRGTGPKLLAYTRLSGPGWLQGAITLGGGSLAGSLYLGVLAGWNLMWLQPLAMLMGVIMLSAIGYVTLSSGERPLAAINRHVNPVLGWGWAIATLMANLVWCMPQFALGTAALQQNLLPGVLGPEALGPRGGTIACILLLLVAGSIVVWFYDSGSWGIRLFERILKLMVAVVVLSFFAVVAVMTTGGALDWPAIFRGFVPDLSLLHHPAPTIRDAVAATGDYAAFWTQRIISDQRSVMVTAAATAVGINMTFLLPYSMLAKKWDREFRGLAIFDLATGLFIPFMLATSCVVIASASQFHARPSPGLVAGDPDGNPAITPAPNLVRGYEALTGVRVRAEIGDEAFAALTDEEGAALREGLPLADRRMAAMLVHRDAFNLADALEPLTGPAISQRLFGIGVLGMALSTIIILMLINGFVVCEMLGQPPRGAVHRAGALLAGIVGATGPFLWAGKAQFWLAVPTSLFGMTLLPIAYITFFALMNQRKLLGDQMPAGLRRIRWNVLMAVAVALAAFGAAWSIWSRTQMIPGTGLQVRWLGVGAVVVFISLALIAHIVRSRRPAPVSAARVE